MSGVGTGGGLGSGSVWGADEDSGGFTQESRTIRAGAVVKWAERVWAPSRILRDQGA